MNPAHQMQPPDSWHDGAAPLDRCRAPR